jgi:hypothetical protein
MFIVESFVNYLKLVRKRVSGKESKREEAAEEEEGWRGEGEKEGGEGGRKEGEEGREERK